MSPTPRRGFSAAPPATPPSPIRVDIQIRSGVWVPPWAMGCGHVTGRGRVPSQHVLSHRYCLQVPRVHASNNPAEMVDREPLTDWADSEFVGDPVGVGGCHATPELSVAGPVQSPLPEPAFVGAAPLDLGPKPLLKAASRGMCFQETKRLALDVTPAAIGPPSNRRLLPTPAAAEHAVT